MVHTRLLLFLLLLLGGWHLSTAQGFRKIYPNQPFTQFNDVVETAHGHFFMVGRSPTAPTWIQLTDPVGNVIWSYALTMGNANPVAAVQIPHGDFVVLAKNFTDVTGGADVVFRVGTGGNIVWQRPFFNLPFNGGFQDLVVLPDSSIVVAGSGLNSSNDRQAGLLRLLADGTPDWSVSFGDPDTDDFGIQIITTSAGGLAVGGFSAPRTGGADAGEFFLALTDQNGQIGSFTQYPKPGSQIMRDLVQTPDGGFALLAETRQINPMTASVLKTTPDAQEQWYVGIPQVPVLMSARSVTCDTSGNIYLHISSGDGVYVDSSLLIRLSPNAEVVHAKSFEHRDLAFKMMRTHDHSLGIVGSIYTFQGAFLSKLNYDGEPFGNTLTGRVYHDANDDCQQQPQEANLQRFRVQATSLTGLEFFTETDPSGAYQLLVGEGTWRITARPAFGLSEAWVACDTPAVLTVGLNGTYSVPPLALRSLTNCPMLDLNIGAGLIRPCRPVTFNVHYCNSGTGIAEDASVVLQVDEQLTYTSSSIPLSSQNGQELRFDLGDLPVGFCGDFIVQFEVDCDAALNEIICVEGQIYPDTLCPSAPGGIWDGSNLVVEGECDGAALFRLRNTGLGNMSEAIDYVIIEDLIMIMQGQIKLEAGEDSTIVIPNTPNGKTYYLRTAQAKGHPGGGYPSATVQGCGGNNGTNLLLQLPQNEGDATFALYCGPVLTSYDPNDKQGFPLGWGEEHYLEFNQDIDYLIRFQNTGNDTAFLVVLRDTLSPHLDMGSVRPGPSSHPYQVRFGADRVLNFTFPNILLPDSNVNEAASHGYVRFRVSQQRDLPLGTRIENRAGIYFDFNPVVLTNTTAHTLSRRLLSFSLDLPDHSIGLHIAPNPVADEAWLHLEPPLRFPDLRFCLFDVAGRPLREENFQSPRHLFQRKGLPAGTYFFALQTPQGIAVAKGKIVIQ